MCEILVFVKGKKVLAVKSLLASFLELFEDDNQCCLYRHQIHEITQKNKKESGIIRVVITLNYDLTWLHYFLS